MEYVIISRYFLKDLSDEVNVWLNQGWKLQGGVAAAEETIKNSKRLIFIQAIVKE